MFSDSNYEFLVVNVDGRVYNNNYFRYALEINILEISNNTKLRYVEKMLLFFNGDVVFVQNDTWSLRKTQTHKHYTLPVDEVLLII